MLQAKNEKKEKSNWNDNKKKQGFNAVYGDVLGTPRHNNEIVMDVHARRNVRLPTVRRQRPFPELRNVHSEWKIDALINKWIIIEKLE